MARTDEARGEAATGDDARAGGVSTSFVLATLVRAGCVLLAVGAVQEVASTLVSATVDRTLVEAITPALVGWGGAMALALLGWVLADVFARLALWRPGGPLAVAIDAPALQALVFSAIGLWQVVDGLSNLVYWLVQRASVLRVLASTGFPTASGAEGEWVAGIAYSAAQLVLGLALLVGARGLVGALRRFRAAGA